MDAPADRSPDKHHIVIAGAGAVGGLVGGLLAGAGRAVTLLGREGAMRQIAEQGLRVTDRDGLDLTIAPASFRAGSNPALLKTATLVLVTVKAGDTEEMGRSLATHLPPGVPVISLQNGVSNAALLRAALPDNPVLAGMVPYNVTRPEALHLHRGSAGKIHIETGRPELVKLLAVPGLQAVEEKDIEAVLWGKLLINLNNALNALSGLPLRDQLRDRSWRHLLAAQIEEANAILRMAGIRAKSPFPLPMLLLPSLLRLPALAFDIVKMDAHARSSMWDDLERRRTTEIDFLQGEILALARRHELEAPVISGVTAAIKRAQAAQAGSPKLRAEQVIGFRHLLADRYDRQKR